MVEAFWGVHEIRRGKLEDACVDWDGGVLAGGSPSSLEREQRTVFCRFHDARIAAHGSIELLNWIGPRDSQKYSP